MRRGDPGEQAGGGVQDLALSRGLHRRRVRDLGTPVQPRRHRANVGLTCITPDGPVNAPRFALEPHRRRTVNLAEAVPDQWSVPTTVASDIPVIAERAVYWNSREGGHDSTGHASP